MDFLRSFFLKGSNRLDHIYFIPNFLTQNECIYILKRLDDFTFKKAHQIAIGRNNKEIFTEDNLIKHLIISKIQNNLKGIKVIDLSEVFEFYLYESGDYIIPHIDSSVELENGKLSNYTAIIYLNDNFIGGETYFESLNLKIKPLKGALLLFNQNLIHEALVVENGLKFIYRSNWLIKG